MRAMPMQGPSLPPPRAEPSQQKSGLAAASLQLRVRLYQ